MPSAPVPAPAPAACLIQHVAQMRGKYLVDANKLINTKFAQNNIYETTSRVNELLCTERQ